LPSAPFSLIPPSGFLPGPSGHAINHVCHDASIAAIAVFTNSIPPSPFPHNALPSRDGIMLLRATPASVEGVDTILELIRHNNAHPPREEWLLLKSARNTTFLWRASYPAEMHASFRQPFRETLESIRVDNRERVPAIPFELDVVGLEPRKFWNTSVFTQPGEQCPTAPDHPTLLAMSYTFDSPVVPLESYADQAIRQMPVAGLELVSVHTPVTFDGLQGFQTFARARDPRTNSPLSILQVILFDGAHGYLIAGRVGSQHSERWIPRFALAAEGFHRIRHGADNTP